MVAHVYSRHSEIRIFGTGNVKVVAKNTLYTLYYRPLCAVTTGFVFIGGR